MGMGGGGEEFSTWNVILGLTKCGKIEYLQETGSFFAQPNFLRVYLCLNIRWKGREK